MRAAIFVLACLGLAGCATTQPEPVIKTVVIEKPVPVPCVVQPVTKPAFAVDALPLGSSLPQQMRALRAERHQRIGYESVLEAEIDRCMKKVGGNVD